MNRSPGRELKLGILSISSLFIGLVMLFIRYPAVGAILMYTGMGLSVHAASSYRKRLTAESEPVVTSQQQQVRLVAEPTKHVNFKV